MRNMFGRCGATILVLLTLSACGQEENTQVEGTAPESDVSASVMAISGDGIRTHMEILAADDMEGREAGTDAYDRAADYVAAQYRAAGLKPLGDDESYFQKVEFLETRLAPDTATLSFAKDGAKLDLVFADDFIRSGGYGAADEQIEAPLVFVGHGICAPELGHDDFAGVDVTGKIMVVLSGAPPQFGTDQRAFYSSSRGKQAVAVERGAVGVLAVRTPVDMKRRPWARYLPSIGTAGMRWVDAEGAPFAGHPELAGSATLSPSGAEKLFAMAEQDLEQIFDKHEAGETGSFDMGMSANLARSSLQRKTISANVVGVLNGSDPVLKDEYVVYTAHLDHIGVRSGEDGDDIHNGAYDNAAGIAAILEIASAMAAMDTPPRRSVIFAAVTAEEKGLQGSSYFARNPPVPVASLVANINIDMPFLGFPVADVQAFGAEHSTLYASVEEATGLMGMALTPDPMPEEVRFVRSDQFSFVKEGIPALAFKAGDKSSNPEMNGKEMLAHFLKNNYHRPSDDLTLPYDKAGAARFVQAGMALGLIVANDDERPRWNENDFFGDKFAK